MGPMHGRAFWQVYSQTHSCPPKTHFGRDFYSGGGEGCCRFISTGVEVNVGAKTGGLKSVTYIAEMSSFVVYMLGILN